MRLIEVEIILIVTEGGVIEEGETEGGVTEGGGV